MSRGVLLLRRVILLSRESFISTISPAAVLISRQYNLPAQVTVAMACIESKNGESELAVNAKNFFGRKYDNIGEYYVKTTNEYLSCSEEEAHAQGFITISKEIGLYAKPLPFKVFNSFEESCEHYCKRITTYSKYSPAVQSLPDVDQYINLLIPVYAPRNTGYIFTIKAVIEEYDLAKLDIEGEI
jgi:flagellum-specific peptidoglycan hydrolase FlgJ